MLTTSHGANCGHEQVPHGNHVDYLVGDHLHHVHGSHATTTDTLREKRQEGRKRSVWKSFDGGFRCR
jgi:hypothetical protein